MLKKLKAKTFMKITLITSFLVLQFFLSNAKINECISIGKKLTFTSQKPNENRTLCIYTANITSQIPNPEKRYPVMYLLDGYVTKASSHRYLHMLIC